MPVRTVTADSRIRDDREKIVVQRGPLIFCAEWPDNTGGKVLNLVLTREPAFTTEFVPSLLGGTQIIKTTGYQTISTHDGKTEALETEPVTLIPYAFWNNRERQDG